MKSWMFLIFLSVALLVPGHYLESQELNKFSVVTTVEQGSCSQAKYETFSYSKEASLEPKFFFPKICKY